MAILLPWVNQRINLMALVIIFYTEIHQMKQTCCWMVYLHYVKDT